MRSYIRRLRQISPLALAVAAALLALAAPRTTAADAGDWYECQLKRHREGYGYLMLRKDKGQKGWYNLECAPKDPVGRAYCGGRAAVHFQFDGPQEWQTEDNSGDYMYAVNGDWTHVQKVTVQLYCR